LTRNGNLKLITIALALTFGITACASSTSSTGGNRGNLKRLKTSKEVELRQSWKDYTVHKRNRPSSFQRGFVAFVYKLKNDKKIILDDQWIEVTSDEMKAKGKIFDGTTSAEILGHNQELYGYLVYRSADFVSVSIVDEQTVQLNYRYNRNYSQ
jgi:regulatory protein YycI of two-component signal transduction system YycFG